MSNILDRWELDSLAELFRRAGSIALDYYDNPPAELKDDRSVVTAADRRIEEFFSEFCDRAECGVYLIGEETVEKHPETYIQEALQSSCCWVLDPIDGTAPYSAHFDMWGISLGFMQKGKLQEGAVYFPALDELIASKAGKVYTRKLQQPSQWQEFMPRRTQLGSAGHIAIGQYPAHEWRFEGANQLFAWSCCVGSVYWMLLGRVISYCGDFKLWDIAGMLPVLNALGYPVLSTAEPGKLLSGDLNDNMFELTPGKRRWRVKSPVITAPNREIALELLEKFHAF